MGKPSRIETARTTGYRDGYRGYQHCRANYQSPEEWLAWYAGWQEGRDKKQKALIERMHVAPEFAAHYWSRGYAA